MSREGFHHIRGNALMALSFIRRSFPVGLGLFLFLGLLALPGLPPTQQERAAHAGVAQAGREAAQSWYFLPYLARGQGWQTIVMLTNLGSRELRVNFAAYDEDGEFLGASTIRLAAQATRTLETGEVLPESGTLKVEATEHLWVGAIFRTRDGTKAEVLTALGNPSRQLDFPALLPGDLSGKTITLLNPDSASAHLEVVALDQGGAELDRTLLPPLSPMASHTFAVRDLFSGDILQQLSTVRVISDRGIVGLQLVDPPDGDLVGLPALTVTSREWSFPIATQSEAGELWTAVGLFNPREVATSVTVEAFDEANNSLGVIESLTLLPGATHFVLTANRQGGIPLNAAFLKVTSDQAIAGYEVIGVVNGNGLAAALGVRGDDQTVAGLEIAGSKDGSVLNAYPMVRIGDGGVKSTTGSLRSGEWREFIRTVPFGLEKTQVSQGTSFTLSFPLPNKSYDTAIITTYFDHSARYDDSGNYRNYCPDGIMISYDGRGGSRQGPVIFELAYNNRDSTLTIFGRDFDNNAKVIFEPTTDPTKPIEPTITSRRRAELTVLVPSKQLNNGIYRVTVVSGSVSSNWVAFQKTSTGISPRNCSKNLEDYIQEKKLSEWSYGGIYYDAHPGYDFGTRYDDGRDTGIIDVLAAADGTVVEVRPSYGKITIEHQGGQYRTVYAHLSKCFYNGSYYEISDRTCQRLIGRGIQRGQIIGKSGYTGLSSGPHLHFEVRKSINGILVPIDPYGWQGLGTDPYRYSTTLLWDPSPLPTATTGPASSTSNSATLNATVNPNGSATMVYFQWGTYDNRNNSTPLQSIGSGTSNVNVSANLSGLLPNTTYYYRIVASNSAGTTYGSWMSFRTALTTTPTVTYFKINNDAASTTSRTVTLNNTATGNPTQYIASESSTFSGATWQPYSTAPSFTLSPGNGTKTVYFKVRNSAGVESPVVSDSIILNESDTTAPTNVQVTAPTSGQTVSGTFTFKATAQDNSGTVQKMEFYVDSDTAPACTDSTAKPSGSTFQCNWNTANKPNGSHTVRAKAYDPSGNFAFSSSVSFTINNVVSDTTPPTNVQVTSPVSGQTISGTFTLRGTAQDNSGTIQKMEFYIDSDTSPACSDTTPKASGSTFQCSWNTANKPNGSHMLKAKAYDPSGYSTSSSSVSFTINNQVPPTYALGVNKNAAQGGTVTSNPAGINCGTGCSTQTASFLAGTVVMLTATAASGWQFSSWSGCDSVSGNQCTVTMNGSRTVWANFTKVVRVANTSGYGLRLRTGPGLSYSVITTLSEGTQMTVIDGPVQADGYTWWRITGSPGTGWSAVGNWLVPNPRY